MQQGKLPLVLVLGSRAHKGIDSLSDQGEPVAVVSLEEAYTKQHSTDAHSLLYFPEPYDSGEDVFRCNKAALPEIREAGGDLLVTRLIVEYDTPGHVAWTQALYEDFESRLGKVTPALAERLQQALAFYTTRAGARWEFLLSEPVSAPQAEDLVRGLWKEFRDGGFPLDETPVLSTWTCLFRLPQVTRENVETWKAPFYFLELNWGRTLDPKTITPIGPSVSTKDLTVSTPSKRRPTPEEALSLLEFKTDRGYSQTDFMKVAKKRLVGRPYWDFVFDNKTLELPPAVSRHDTLKEWIAGAAGLLSGLIEGSIPDLGPEHIYAIFEPVAIQMGSVGDSGGRNWLEELWRLVQWVWAHEQVRIQAEAEKKAVVKAKAIEVEKTILAGVREWFSELPIDEKEARSWLRQRLIIHGGRGSNYVIRPDGWYDHQPVSAEVLGAQIEALGVSESSRDRNEGLFIPTTMFNPKTFAERPATFSEMIKGRCTIAQRVKARPQIKGGYLENPTKTNPILVLPSFERNSDLVPTYDERVDEWLFMVAQQDSSVHERLCRWTGLALAFEKGPICALSFLGDPGVGKQLYARGMAECLRVPATASARDLVDSFNECILRTPFLVVNEAFPRLQAYSHAADAFRHVVGGDSIFVNAKHKSIVEINNPMRVIFTANNIDVVLELCKGKDLRPADRDAIAVRLWHLEAGSTAAEWFTKKGGRDFTQGWVEGSAGEPSEYVVARHFLWLHQQYAEAPKEYTSGRLLMEGDIDSPIVREMQVQGGSTPMVIEAIIGLLNKPNTGTDFNKTGVKIEEDKVYLTSGAIMEFWRGSTIRGFGSGDLTPKKVKTALQGLIVKGTTNKPRRIAGDVARWNEIDVDLILEEANKYGWTCSKLENIKTKKAVDRITGIDAIQAEGLVNGRSN